MHIKNFDKWNNVKKITNKKEDEIYYKEREIWWVSVGVNVGFEIDGKNNLFERPVLILKKVNKNQFIGVPLSSKEKKGYFYNKIRNEENDSRGTSNLSQVRCFSSRRLLRKLSTCSKEDFYKLKISLVNYISK